MGARGAASLSETSCSLPELPEFRALTYGLASILQVSGHGSESVVVLDRSPHGNESTFPNEVVTCRLSDGRCLRLFCKYGGARVESSYGHRGGVPYEASIYREVLHPLCARTARFFGDYTDPISGQTWLVLEYVEGSARLSLAIHDELASASEIMGQAARWIGEFHAASSAYARGLPVRLKVYDAEYYLGWPQRTALFADDLKGRYPWLAGLCRESEAVLGSLPGPTAVIHGEYYPKNLLFRDGDIYPVDWESGAAAVAEIDLASLTEGWPEQLVHECIDAYQRARWPRGAPSDFDRNLDIARLYLQFRWLGDQPEWTTSRYTWRFEELRRVGQRLGLI
jgi:hypothetical protein